LLLQRRFGADGRAADNHVICSECVAECLDDVEERLRVGNEDLDDLTYLRDLAGEARKFGVARGVRFQT
jgi:hypothetical protein